MNYLKQNHLSILIILCLVFLGVSGGNDAPLFGRAPSDLTTFGNPVTFSNTQSPGGITLASTTISTLALRGTATFDSGTTFSSTVTQNGVVTANAGRIASYSKASTTSATAYALTQADILHYDTIRQGLTGGATTFTLPATSTLTDLVPAAGDMEEQCWLPLTNNLIFAAGTGIDLAVATSSSISGAFDLTIAAGDVGCLKYIRKTNTDVHVLLTEYAN